MNCRYVIIGIGATAVLLVAGLIYMRSAQEHQTVIAIATLMTHPALDEVDAGLKAELAKRGYNDKTVKYVERNASGQIQVASTIAGELAASRPNVIVAITTPMAQAIAKVAECPVCFAAVTDPVGAGLLDSWDDVKAQITGTSDAWPYDAQLRLIREVLPNAKRLGVLYNPGEAASQYGIREIRKYAPAHGFELVEGGVSSTAEVHPVAENLASKCDALFLSSDNTVIGGVAGAVKVAVERKAPLFVGDSGTVAKGGIAAVSVGYRALGEQTGVLVDRLLKGERNIPMVLAQGSDVYVNTKAAEMMGVELPEPVIRRAAKVYDSIEP